MSWFRKEANVYQDDPVATNKPGRKVQKRTQGRFFLLGSFQTNNCSLSIRDVNMADSGTYVFRIENYFSEGHTYRDKMLSLKVTGLTQSPTIHIPVILKSGHPGNLTCSVPWACEQGTPPIFFWNLAALTSMGPRTSTSSTLTLFPRPQDHGSNLTCQVTFPAVGVTIKRTVQLNVVYAPQNMVISIFQGNNTVLRIVGNASSLTILEGQSLRLHCTADSNPPARLTWFRGFQTLNTSLFSNLGYVELPQVGTEKEGVFTCQAENELGSQQVLLNLSVHRDPEPRLYSEVLGAVGGAVGGAGIMTLLCLCILLVFR
ncbi:PREDICTED: sialic acid-binding Ig-like lectin 6 [Chrysochloris asiatica]|uniref:Sialic acid-binding Ig-like lectin 6 n=1 Tax=Chrysochloris asiatica TaxID=185453 RepID=A0A9B0TVD6_CHRAS|nr:PREDICTED: sialic acid-binding Ig-like lectin 6 [Chrysochloris asiatica]